MPSITETAATVRSSIEHSPVVELENLMSDHGFDPEDAIQASGVREDNELTNLLRSFPAFAFAFGVIVGRESK